MSVEAEDPNCVDAGKESEAEMSDSAMDATTNGESAHKIPKLMDIAASLPTSNAASLPTPKLMREIAPVAPVAGPSSIASSAGAAGALGFTAFEPSITLEHIRATQHKFVDDRDWHRHHTPRNLLLAMVGEVGELSELFQWRGEVGVLVPDWSDDDKRHLRHELADVFLYLVRLSEQCGVDLPVAVMEKIALNDRKYPAALVKGSSKKYNDFEFKKITKLAVPQDVSGPPGTKRGADASDY